MEKNVNPEIQKVADKIKDIKTAMLVTADEDGNLRSRPMQTLQIEGSDLYYLTGYHSGKTYEIKNDSQVNITFADESNKVYVSVSGIATVSKDKQKIEELWNEAFKAWFPEGKEDPNIAVLKVKVTGAEYWDTPSSPVVHVIGYAKAVLTGQQYKPGEHEKISVS